MTPAFTLQVPADPRFRRLASEMVGRYVEIVGGSEAERTAFTRALADAVDGLVRDASESVELACVAHTPDLEVTVRCAGREAVVRHSVAAGKR